MTMKIALFAEQKLTNGSLVNKLYYKYLFDYDILPEMEKKLLNDPEIRAYYDWAKRNKDKRV